MKYEIRTIRHFEKEIKALMKRYPSLKADLIDLIKELEEDPTTGTDLGSGLRKIRLLIKSKGKGKSAGARVITYNVVANIEEGIIYLVSIYDKSDYSSISIDQVKKILKEQGVL